MMTFFIMSFILSFLPSIILCQFILRLHHLPSINLCKFASTRMKMGFFFGPLSFFSSFFSARSNRNTVHLKTRTVTNCGTRRNVTCLKRERSRQMYFGINAEHCPSKKSTRNFTLIANICCIYLRVDVICVMCTTW